MGSSVTSIRRSAVSSYSHSQPVTSLTGRENGFFFLPNWREAIKHLVCPFCSFTSAFFMWSECSRNVLWWTKRIWIVCLKWSDVLYDDSRSRMIPASTVRWAFGHYLSHTCPGGWTSCFVLGLLFFWGVFLGGGFKRKTFWCQRGPPKPWESVSHCCHLVCNSKETIFWSSTKRIGIYTYICTGIALVVLHFGIILVTIIDKLLFMTCMHVVACVSFKYLKSLNISKVKSSQS